MIRFDFSKSSLGDEAVQSRQPDCTRIHDMLEKECQSNQVGWWHLPFDEDSLRKIRLAAKEAAYRFDNLVVVGIGGSATGLKALLRALSPQSNLKIFLQESPDPEAVRHLLSTLDLSKTCFNIVSKSGETVETMALFEFFRGELEKKVKEKWTDHVVATTQETNSPLYSWVQRKKLRHFPVPKNVGGRFSVFSPVGLFPLACAGADVEKIVKGASEALVLYGTGDVGKNPAYRNGLIHHLLNEEKGKRISVMMIYCEALKNFGEWYSQLWAESLGKEGRGQTPLACQGPQAQHSLAQLVLDGPKDKVVTFLRTAPQRGDPLGELMEKECRATAQAFHESGTPSVMLTLPDLSEETLGELLMFYQLQTSFTGHLIGINPYDQPAVERIKRLLK